ncbi:MAG: DUF4292 domain-containing protein, partial [Chitinophagaceae bacterium]
STKKLQTAVNKKDTVVSVKNTSTDPLVTGKNLLGTLNSNRINFNTFSAKIKVEYEDSKGKQPDVNAIVRMQKDSVIWISINATFLSIEAFRILITKNKVIILNKLKKQVEEHPFSFIEKIAKIPLDFKTLQDLIVGNPIYLGDNVVGYKVTENRILLSTIGKYFKNLITLSANNNLIERSKLDDIDVSLNRTGDLTYANYENKSGVNFATKREITVAEKTKVDIKLDFKQYDFNTALSYPFSIPANFNKK